MLDGKHAYNKDESRAFELYNKYRHNINDMLENTDPPYSIRNVISLCFTLDFMKGKYEN